MEMDKLYSPAKLGEMNLKNRWIMLAMHTGYANDDGTFSERDLAFYSRRAKGGAAAITLVGGVNEIGCQANMHRLDSEKYDEGIRQACKIIHEQDCKVIMQLFHAGRNNTTAIHKGRSPLAPSPVESPIYRTIPKEMTEDDIKKTIADFAEAAERCKKCGADCVEVSVSAGYLLSEFLSPLVNFRNDHWGGSAKKRMAFPTEVLKAIRRKVGENYTVIIKISGSDMLGGYDVSDMVSFINQLPKGTINGVTVTGGWHEAPVPQISYHVLPGSFSYLAEDVAQRTGLPVIACNRINDGRVAERILDRGIIRFVGAARPFLTDPDFANKIKNDTCFNKCQGCNRGCIERVLKYKDVCCAFNPEAGKEYLGKPKKKHQEVLVVGAGPVGLELARLLLMQGTGVTVITDESAPGGKLDIISRPPLKQDLKLFKEYLLDEVLRLGGTVLTDTPMKPEIIEGVSPEHVYFATGSAPVSIYIDGLEKSSIKCFYAEDILAGKIPKPASRVVIIGGGTAGLETAEYLASLENEYDITVLEMQRKAGMDLGGLRWIEMKALNDLGVKVKTSSRVFAAGKDELYVEENKSDQSGNTTVSEIVYKCDVIIYAAGSRPRGALGLEEYLESRNIGYSIIGDGIKPGNIMQGIQSAWNETR